ncbi:sulfurtransferase [Rhodococcus sp. NPDC056743]|uniref:sulfurtransferase n=1 Tax=Rhodococcus sp. NPDC056743 TaxID=3345934 RepID=UPI0036701DA8
MTTKSLPALVDVAWLKSHVADQNLVVVDATTHLPVPTDGPYTPESGGESYRSAHIEGALFADLLTDFADPDSTEAWTVPSSERFAAAAGALGIGDGATVVIYDQHDGFWATRLWWHLRLEGFDSVAVLDGGLRAWQAAGLPVTDAVSTPTARTFTGARRPELLRSTEDVAAALDDPETILVNVLDPATYRGETNTYARRGHIPGSVNLPVFEVRNQETGELRSVEELRALFDAAGLLDTNKKVVTYCGGGIAATGVAHALALAGREDVGVYDGSMTAWAGNPDLPLVTGPSPR